MNDRDLTELFRQLGARNPSIWARSQYKENIPQLARFLFLREAWTLIIGDTDTGWAEELCKITYDSPGGEAGPSLSRLLAGSGSIDDLSKVVRVMQWRLLSGICQLLDDGEGPDCEAKGIAWRLFQVDEAERPIVAIRGLVESVLETEPSGREMRPKESNR